jgi:hypothetical protein
LPRLFFLYLKEKLAIEAAATPAVKVVAGHLKSSSRATN